MAHREVRHPNGVVNHGGTDAEPAIDGADRGFWSRLQLDSFPSRLQLAGFHTVSVSSFAQRHSAFHWYAGFDEAYNVGKIGLETADEVLALAADWLGRRGPRRTTGSSTCTSGTRTRRTARRPATASPSPTSRCRPG